ncbi:methionyl-tRNA formyltransferase, mitochondrial isoform X2 [Leuresthes tenuis]|uniref:methionyl-tRNA formyltransferase, mitochondrial isoform X2 n=1 Tax=Leuresthes tenuis TaxID=355514 RepID=UPI003B504CB4
MWTNGRTAGAFLKSLYNVQHCCMRTEWRESIRGCKLMSSSSTAPWRLLFFGTDQFAVESLKLLTTSRNSTEGIVENLEVVTLPGDVPVKRFAQQNNLTLHSWPPDNIDGQFDVGVVVSFGCLLHERLINKFPYGILNVHPSLLPRWRGPAPIFHTIMQSDTVTGVTIIQILPHKFDIGPILNQEVHQVPKNCTADELGATLATKGAYLLIDTLKKLPEKIANKWEQGQTGATFAPKIGTSMSWLVWEEQTCDEISCLYRAIGSRIKGRPPSLALCVMRRSPIHWLSADGWVGFKAVLLKKRLSATDFYNGYLHQTSRKNTPNKTAEGQFVSKKAGTKETQRRKNSTL